MTKLEIKLTLLELKIDEMQNYLKKENKKLEEYTEHLSEKLENVINYAILLDKQINQFQNTMSKLL